MTISIDMEQRLLDMPIMAQRPGVIDVKVFNLWRRYRLQPEADEQFKLPGLKSMRFIVSDRFWVVADSANYYVPVLAWVNFDVAGRTSLHEPVACSINYYHFAASAIRGKSLELLRNMFEQELAANAR